MNAAVAESEQRWQGKEQELQSQISELQSELSGQQSQVGALPTLHHHCAPVSAKGTNTYSHQESCRINPHRKAIGVNYKH